MERSSLSSSLKDHCIGSRSSCLNDSKKKQDSNSNRLKDSWSYSRHNYGEDYLGGFPWPPRSYSCSFCKREFRSAQALGGHMNVHRRDRARLRQSPPSDGHCPILNLNPNPNPNPRFSPPLTCTLPSLVSPPLSALSSPSLGSPSKNKQWAVDGIPVEPLSPKAPCLTKTGIRESFFGAEEFDGVTPQNGCKLTKKGEYVRLDLEIGLPPDSMEDLDLELRLGFS